MAREGQKEKLYSTVQWRIENLDVWESEFHPRCIESCKFKLNNYNSNNFKMSLHLDKNDPNRGVSIYFHDPTIFTIGEFEWLIMGGDGMPILRSDTERSMDGIFYMLSPPSYLNLFMNRNSSLLPNGAFTVQLRIFKTEFIKAEHVSLVSRLRKAPAESFVRGWRIERFGTLQLDEEAVTSIKLGDAIFKLIFSLRGDSLENADVNFRIVAEKPLHQSLKATLSVLDQDEKEAMVVEEKLLFESGVREQIWLLSKFFSRRKILERASDLLHGEDLRLLCKFTLNLKYNRIHYIERYYCGPANLTTDTIPKRKIQISLPNTILGEDLMSAYNEQIMNDFELRSGDVSFPVHKIVLSARSPVFKAMFCGHLKESGSKSMDVPDLDVHTLGRMLTFMYSGTVDDLECESAAKLYYAADKYELLSLKQQCAAFLRYNLTVSNVSDILELADRHQDSELTSLVHEFIGDNFEKVIASAEWDKFLEKGSLAGKTMKEVLQKRVKRRKIC